MVTNTKTITAIIVFVALALAISPIRIPALYWPGQYYRIWEIPLIVAFFLFGFKIAYSASILFALGHVALLPGALGIFAFPWLITLMLIILLGLHLAKSVIRGVSQQENNWKKHAFYFTLFGILFRTLIMPFVDYGIYRFLFPLVLGQSFSDALIIGLMPGIIFFNLTVPFYAIPISYFTAKTVSKSLRIGNLS
jgi:hypothetical protein